MLTKPVPKFSRLCPVIKTNFRPMEVRKGSYPFIFNKSIRFDSIFISDLILLVTIWRASITVLPVTNILSSFIPSNIKFCLLSSVGAK